MQNVYIFSKKDYDKLCTLVGMINDELKREIEDYTDEDLREKSKIIQDLAEDLNRVIYSKKS